MSARQSRMKRHEMEHPTKVNYKKATNHESRKEKKKYIPETLPVIVELELELKVDVALRLDVVALPVNTLEVYTVAVDEPATVLVVNNAALLEMVLEIDKLDSNTLEVG